jgi:hypothetical protein
VSARPPLHERVAASSTKPRSESAGRRRAPALDGFDAAVLAALAVLSVGFLAALVIHGGALTGIEGFIGADQAQYLAWIRETAEHLLIADPFDLAPDARAYLQPALLPPALLHVLGLAPPVAYLVWKPVAVGVLFWGTRRYVRQMLAGVWERRVALVVALFFVPPAAALGAGFLDATDRADLDFIAGEWWTSGHFWGYPLTAVAAGLTPLVFIWAERAVPDAGERAALRPTLLAAAAALFVSWVHPWQGSILLGTLTLAGAWQSRARMRALLTIARGLTPILLAGVAPLVYFAILTRYDDAWKLGFDVYQRLEHWPVQLLVFAVAPLVIPALLGYRGPVASLQERILRVWPPMALLIYYAPFASFPFHAFTGVALPLAVLAVRGTAPLVRQAEANAGPVGRRWVIPAVVVAAVALLVAPGVGDRLAAVRTAVRANFEPYRFADGERDAFRALERDPRPGGVLATPFLGQLIPEATGRETWAGTVSWTPDYGARMNATRQLMGGRLSSPEARRLVRASGARFVFADCRARGDLRRQLGDLVEEARRFGCASVYAVRSVP